MQTAETLKQIEQDFLAIAPSEVYCSLRFVAERAVQLRVRQNIVQPISSAYDAGIMVTVHEQGATGYSATSDISAQGIRTAIAQARSWAQLAASSPATFTAISPPSLGHYRSTVQLPWSGLSYQDYLELLSQESQRLKIHSDIVDWHASLWTTEADTLLLANNGMRVHQTFQYVVPNLSATAHNHSGTQTRTFSGGNCAMQGGREILDSIGFFSAAPRIAEQALELLAAPNCPSGSYDLLLAPDQMILQIHESIGHPLELDRILGDERNYAGTSFVTLDMFGQYQYGSPLLNVSYDPTRLNQLVSFAYDDEGHAAHKQYIIRDGILERALGGYNSQTRADMAGVAASRACNWNRPPIDRMANLNVEPGNSSLEDMIASVERGIYLETNCSWSIDDSRNKFQFGCEWGRLIENGQLTSVVKNPNYRGISATFWRNLKQVGDASTLQTLGTPYCGKGEPNQMVRVGHATPACLFAGVDIFGGA